MRTSIVLATLLGVLATQTLARFTIKTSQTIKPNLREHLLAGLQQQDTEYFGYDVCDLKIFNTYKYMKYLQLKPDKVPKAGEVLNLKIIGWSYANLIIPEIEVKLDYNSIQLFKGTVDLEPPIDAIANQESTADFLVEETKLGFPGRYEGVLHALKQDGSEVGCLTFWFILK